MADDLVEYLLDCDALLRASKRIETPSRAGITAYKAAADEITRLRAAVEAERETVRKALYEGLEWFGTLPEPEGDVPERYHRWDDLGEFADRILAAIRTQPKEGE